MQPLRELPLGPGLSGWSPVLCLFSSVFPAWIQPMFVWGVVDWDLLPSSDAVLPTN